MNCQYFNTLTLRATLPGGGDFLLVRSRRSVGRVSCVLVYTPFKKHATLISNQKHLQKEHASLVPSRGQRAPIPRCRPGATIYLQILTSGVENIPLVRKKRITLSPSAQYRARVSSVKRPSRIVQKASRALTRVDTPFASLDTPRGFANHFGRAHPPSRRRGVRKYRR